MFAIRLQIGRRGVLAAREVLVSEPRGVFHFAALM
jgi:hypothetical protein